MVSPDLLRCYPFFAGLTREQLLALTWFARPAIYETGETLFHQDDPATRLYLLVDGRARILIEYNHHREIITDLEPGDIFGWSALVPPHLCTATAECTLTSDVISFDAAALRQLMAADPVLNSTLMTRIAGVVASRLREAYVWLASLVPA